MIIECEFNPSDLIGQIGDPNFSICDQNYDALFRHRNHPYTLRIIDCEHETTIDVTGHSKEDTRKIAESICKLLNQDYNFPCQEIE